MTLLQAVYIISVAVLRTASSSGVNCSYSNLGITGGHKVSIEDVPFMAQLYVKNTTSGIYMAKCGGSIVHERFVLTAAHCLFYYTDTPKRVLIGSDHLNAGGMMVDVAAEFCYQGFNDTEYYGDICLLKLGQSVQFGCKVAKVTLPDEGYELDVGTMVNVTGWGYTGEDASSWENKLYQTEIPILSEECCVKIQDNSKFCAGSVGHNACQGDSGGPATYNDVQVGIVSYGPLPCNMYPAVYTRITSYLKWIEATIQDNL